MKKRDEPTFKEKLGYLGGALFICLWSFIAGLPFAAVLIFLLFAAYLKTLALKFQDRRYHFLSMGFLLLLGSALIVFLRAYTQISPYWIPVAAFAMLTTLLFRELELSLIMSFVLSIFAGMIFGGDINVAAAFFAGCILSSLCVWQARRRSKIITAGFCVGAAQAACAAASSSVGIAKPSVMLAAAGAPFFGGLFASFIVAGLLPVFESLFKVVTNISLLELADFNHPLLKRLVLEAPGTYHHSLMVGNLAEVASESVGANALLARVGAYYHDIGKLEKAEYFSENQDRRVNKHDELSASMSKLVIMEHVRFGVELAKRGRLNAAIIDFITQHHGTSLVYYFYRRALEATPAEQDVKEEVFRYPGPKPQSKEAAIVLLADSVEAACRALEEPTAGRISDIVRRIINNKFIDGQLDACDLTLRDLEKIGTVFIHMLGAFYHSRVDYSDKNKNKGSAEQG